MVVFCNGKSQRIYFQKSPSTGISLGGILKVGNFEYEKLLILFMFVNDLAIKTNFSANFIQR